MTTMRTEMNIKVISKGQNDNTAADVSSSLPSSGGMRLYPRVDPEQQYSGLSTLPLQSQHVIKTQASNYVFYLFRCSFNCWSELEYHHSGIYFEVEYHAGPRITWVEQNVSNTHLSFVISSQFCCCIGVITRNRVVSAL